MKPIRWTVQLTVMLILLLLAACASAVQPDPKAAKPSNPGGTGAALTLTGDVSRGQAIFSSTCSECHGDQGKGGVLNGDTPDKTIPALNPIDPSIYNANPKVFAANMDLFLEHGSTPKGNPNRIMMPFGDSNILKSQDIADVMAYVISLNPGK